MGLDSYANFWNDGDEIMVMIGEIDRNYLYHLPGEYHYHVFLGSTADGPGYPIGIHYGYSINQSDPKLYEEANRIQEHAIGNVDTAIFGCRCEEIPPPRS